MGMFDYVNFKMQCPNCGRETENFQSKDGKCWLETVEPDTVDEFYTMCRCDTWIEFSRVSTIENKKHREIQLTKTELESLGFTLIVKQ